MKKRIGIVGLGSIAQKVYLPLLTKSGRIEVAGIMSRNGSKVKLIQDQYRIHNGFTNLNDLLSERLDAVFVHASTESHFEIITSCLSKGIAVYADKPLSYSITESIQMNDLAEKKKLLLAVGFNRRFAPKYVEAKDWVSSTGGITSCNLQKHRTTVVDQNYIHTIYDDLIHMLDLMLWINSKPSKQLNACIEKNEKEQLLSAAGLIKLSNSTGLFSMERRAGCDIEKVELVGTGRSAEIVNMEVSTLFEKDKKPMISTFGSWDDILLRRGFVSIVNHFLDCLDNPQDCTVNSSNVMATHFLVEELININ